MSVAPFLRAAFRTPFRLSRFPSGVTPEELLQPKLVCEFVYHQYPDGSYDGNFVLSNASGLEVSLSDLPREGRHHARLLCLDASTSARNDGHFHVSADHPELVDATRYCVKRGWALAWVARHQPQLLGETTEKVCRAAGLDDLADRLGKPSELDAWCDDVVSEACC
jgi:hypothetical protein